MITYNKNNDIQPDIKDVYRKVGSLELPVLIFNPQIKNDKNSYAVICIHGGGWRTGIKPETEWKGGDMLHQAKIFAQLGFVGVAISYRCLTNEGADIRDLIDDCKKAVLYVKERLRIDNEHIILIGDSAGAHLATCLGISDDDNVRPDTVISCNPVLDCTGVFAYVADDETVRTEASPVFATVNKCARFLFMHGDKDPTTPISDTIVMNEKLKKLGFDSEMITLENVMHAFILYNYRSTDEQVAEYMTMIEDYLKRKVL